MWEVEKESKGGGGVGGKRKRGVGGKGGLVKRRV